MVVCDAHADVGPRGRGEEERSERKRQRQPYGAGTSLLHRRFVYQDCTTLRTASNTVAAPKRTGSSVGRPVSSSTARAAACASSSASARVWSAIAATRAGRDGSEARSWSSTISGSDGSG